MTAFKKCLICILLLFSTVGTVIGYAALTDNLAVTGTAEVEGKPFEGVYIYESAFYSTTNVQNISLEHYMPTNFSNLVNLSVSGASITYKITVHNNTSVTYWYNGAEFLPNVESNSLIGAKNGISIMTKDHPNDTTATFNSEDWIPPNTYRDFYVTYTYGSAATGYKATLVNFVFGLHMDGVHDKFVTVLNDGRVGGGYDKLSEVFDEKFSETGERVIANIGEEKAIFDELFGKDLTVTVDGEELPVTVMVRRENVDDRNTGDSYSVAGGGTGCEYTVYITVDPLDSPTGKAIVYAVSYSKGGVSGTGGNWYQIGQLYEGTANKIDYDPSMSGVQGAVDIYSWQATANRYEAADGIVYLVGQDQGDQYDKLKTLEDIMSTNDQDIFNDIDNRRIFKTVYDIVHNYSNAGKAGYDGLRSAFEAAAPFYNIFNNGQEIKVKRECTRAEILPYLEEIQQALDYYNEVN